MTGREMERRGAEGSQPWLQSLMQTLASSEATAFAQSAGPERTLLVTAEVVRRKLDVADGELLGRRVQRGLEGRQPVVLEHVEERLVRDEGCVCGYVISESTRMRKRDEMARQQRQAGREAGVEAAGAREGASLPGLSQPHSP